MFLPDSLEELVNSVVESIGIDSTENERRQSYLNITDKDIDLLRCLHQPLHQVRDQLMDAFYSHLLAFPETSEYLKNPDTLNNLKDKQWQYLAALTEGKYDWEYVKNRLRVGIVHQKIGLEPKWYIGAYNNYLCTVIEQIHLKLEYDEDQVIDVIKALLKIIFLDIGLVLDTYFHAAQHEILKLKDFAEGVICNVPGGLIVLDKNLCVLSANRFIEQFPLTHHETLKGLDIETVLPGLGLHHRLVEVMANKVPQHGIVFERPDEKVGTEHFEITITPMRQQVPGKTEKGDDEAVLMVVIEDISQQEYYKSSTREADTRVRAIMDNVAEGVITIDEKGLIESFNLSAEHLYGYTASEVLGKNINILMPEPYHSEHNKYLECYQVSNERHHPGKGFREVEGRKKNGEIFAMELSISEIPLADKKIYVGVINDITHRKESQATMSRLSSALEQTADSVMITNEKGVIEYVNAGFEQTTGYSREDSVGKTPNLLKSGMQDKAFYNNLWKTILAGDVFSDVIINRHKNGKIYYEEKTISPLRDERGNISHFISSGKDITERMQTHERLQYLAHHDVLTELPNRLLFLDRLSQAIRHSRRTKGVIALMFLDLDRFKVINDTLGHQVGDLLLKEMAQRLRKTIREEDTVARLSGDEFAVLLLDMHHKSEAATLAKNILKKVTEPFQIEGRELFLTSSIGISVFPENGGDANTMLKHADVAMYQSKETGRNTYCFYNNAMDAQAHESLTLENDLRRALERNEFCLHYQPQISSGDKMVTGAEALLRWQHPKRGLLLPEIFIQLLEDTGLIIDVGDWVLDSACMQIRRWHDADIDLPQVSVNIAPRQLADPGLPDKIQAILEKYHLEPSALELEITESTLMNNEDQAIKILMNLHNNGVSIAMDDFGTGYSSLRYLRQFPLRTLKIDRAFINNLPYNNDDCNLASAIITMGHGLQLNVIAEGVETEAQQEFLHKQGCDQSQGYLFSRPIPGHEMGKFLEDIM